MKYYTPSIEEFHVGFEFQGFADNGWEDESIRNWRELCTVIDRYSHTAGFRVKHLDREDIESEGLEYDNNAEPIPERDYNQMLIPKAFSKGAWMLYHYEIDNVVWIENYDTDSFYFKGVIKNKSELKKLLKQLGI